MGAPRRAARARSRTSSSRCCCGPPTPSATPTIPTTSSRRSSRSRPQAGIDLFRIFDALNWLPNLQLAIEAVREHGHALRGGHLLHRRHPRSRTATKYDLKYYVDLAKELEKLGANILGHQGHGRACASRTRPRSWSGRCEQEVGIPIHFHTHDTAGGQIASLLMAAEEGVDIVDCAHGAAVGHDQPAEPERAGRGAALHRRATPASTSRRCSDDRRLLGGGARATTRRSRPASWPPTADVYRHEMPGGQYTNLYPAGPGARAWTRAGARSAGCTPRSTSMFGDIVKVTPTSKVVGDMALFMVANNLTPDDVLDRQARAGVPRIGGRVLRGPARPAARRLPGEAAEARAARPQADDRPARRQPAAGRLRRRRATKLEKQLGRPVNDREVVTLSALSARLPRLRRITSELLRHSACCRRRSSSTAWSRARRSASTSSAGKTLIVKFLTVGDPHADGTPHWSSSS